MTTTTTTDSLVVPVPEGADLAVRVRGVDRSLRAIARQPPAR